MIDESQSIALKHVQFCVGQICEEPVCKFLACLEQHALVRELSSSTFYWVCAYANNQHCVEEDIKSNPRSTSFYRAMQMSEGVLLVLDSAGTPFVWRLNYFTSVRSRLTGAAVDGRVTERFGSALSCECGLRSPDREHLTFHCQAQPWDGEFRSATERRLLVPLVDAPPVLPFSNMVADPALVTFIQQFDPLQRPTLGLDGSCIIATSCDRWQRASWAVSTLSGTTVQGAVTGFEQTPAAGERAALLQACLASSAANRPVMLLIDNQALVRRLQRGISTGRWEGDLPLFWQRISGLLIQGTVCIWIPSHNKVPDWTPPDGWIDVHLCRVLNATADAQAGEVLRDSRSMIAAAVQRHQRAVAWAAAVWRLQRLRTLPFWQVVLDQQTFLAEC